MWKFIGNSLFYVLVIIILDLFINSICGYALAKFEFKGKNKQFHRLDDRNHNDVLDHVLQPGQGDIEKAFYLSWGKTWQPCILPRQYPCRTDICIPFDLDGFFFVLIHPRSAISLYIGSIIASAGNTINGRALFYICVSGFCSLYPVPSIVCKWMRC